MRSDSLKSVVSRNTIGVLALLIAYYIPDRFSIDQRIGFSKFSPYLLLLLMYSWIVFHNRVLFEGLYLRSKKHAYLFWAISLMVLSSINMHLVIVWGFDDADSLSKIIGFWVFSIAGLGIYVIFKYQDRILGRPVPAQRPDGSVEVFMCVVDGIENRIPLKSIIYFESLENYVRIVTKQRKYVARLPLKEAEQKLPKSFLRISRSHIVNTHFIDRLEADSLKVDDQVLKIGKVYKKYVEAELGGSAVGAS